MASTTLRVHRGEKFPLGTAMALMGSFSGPQFDHNLYMVVGDTLAEHLHFRAARCSARFRKELVDFASNESCMLQKQLYLKLDLSAPSRLKLPL